MQFLFALFLAVCLIGCAKNKSTVPREQKTPAAVTSGKKIASTTVPEKKSPPAKHEDKPFITPSFEKTGRVSKVNDAGRFVVLTFPGGNVPAPDRRLNLYRNGLKVAEIKVTGPQRDNNTVADIVAGDAQVNDEARGN